MTGSVIISGNKSSLFNFIKSFDTINKTIYEKGYSSNVVNLLKASCERVAQGDFVKIVLFMVTQMIENQ